MKKVEAVEVFRLYESTWSGDEYESSRDSLVGTFPRWYLADKELKKLERNVKDGSFLRYYIKPKLVKPEEVERMFKNQEDVKERPGYFKHIEDVTPIQDTCGLIRELYKSEGMSLAYATLDGKAKRHKHLVMEEVYFVVKGNGYLTVDDDKFKVEEGDTVSIPKGSWHFLEAEKKSPLEVLVATHPKFTLDDVILEEA